MSRDEADDEMPGRMGGTPEQPARFFHTPEEFSAWLAQHHDSETSLWMGLKRKHVADRGLTWEQALAAVTINPANIFGVRSRGTLQTGAAADVVVWSGDPFELSTKVETIVVGGAIQSLTTRQTRLFNRYKKLR